MASITEQRIAEIVAQTLAQFGLVKPAAEAAPAPAADPAPTPEAAHDPASEVVVTLKYVTNAKHAVQSEDGAWFYGPKDAPMFKSAQKGQRWLLTLNEKGRVVRAEGPVGDGTRPATTQEAAQATKPQAQTPPPANNPSLCPFCGGQKHSKYEVEQVRFTCGTRQFQRATGITVNHTDPASVIAYGEWLANNTITVFAFVKAGSEKIGKMGAPAPTPPAARQAVQGPPAAPRAALGASTQGKPEPKIGRSAKPKDAEKLALAQARVGTFTGFVDKHAEQTVGLVRVISTDLPGAKSYGDWLRPAPQYPKLATEIVKTERNDKVRFTLDEHNYITAWEVISKVDEVATPKGTATSGKQQPPAPKPQPVDARVQAERANRKHAATSKNKSVAGLTGKTFSCSGTSTHRNTCFGRCLNG